LSIRVPVRPLGRPNAWLGLALALLVGSAAAAETAPIRLTVVATSDFHGALEPRHAKVLGGREVGGIDILAAYFRAVRRDNPGGVLLLDGGDLYQGTLISAASEGRSVVDFYNTVGYDAVALGNHDFDYGPVGYHSVPMHPDEDPLGVLRERLRQARYPVLAANVHDRRTGQPVDWPNLRPYTILERRGLKVAVVGLITEDTPLVTHPANVRDLEFRPLLGSLRRVLPEVRKKGAQAVIVLAHVGLSVDEKTGHVSGHLAELAKALEPGEVDLIIGGHVHAPFADRVHGVPVMQSWPYGIAFTRCDLFLDRKTGKVLGDRTRLHEPDFVLRAERDGRPVRFLGRTIQPVKKYAQMLQQFRQSIAHLQRIELGRATADLAHQTGLDSPLGNLVTDAMRAADASIDIAMYNAGGIRTSIPSGVVTFGRVYEVVPFDNNLVKVTLTGAQIREILEHGLSAPYGIMEVSGLRVVFDPEAPAGRRIVSVVSTDGRELDPQGFYVVGTNEFVFNGGDGYFTFARGRNVQNTHTLIRELVATYIKTKGTVRPERGGRYTPRLHKSPEPH
jgi:5'-nucleotidase